jgi:hypothetical protein
VGAPALLNNRSSLAKRVLTSIVSVLVVSLVAEIAVRLLTDPPAPLLLRDGIYVSQLGLVNGRDTVARLPAGDHPALAEAKRAGEIRVFVFGESSVQGSPWEYYGSPPSMLHDQLRERFPDKTITVVNMGRGAAMTIDAYYFLVSIARFSPDYVVFYMGGNDEYDASPEMCLPASLPRIYAGWRWLVEHSRALWSARALAPLELARRRGISKGRRGGGKERPRTPCDPDEGFRAWSDVLVSTAQAMGARVIVTTLVQNPLHWLGGRADPGSSDGALRVAEKPESYRNLLRCLLQDDCDAARAAETELEHTDLRQNLEAYAIATRSETWREVAARRSAWIVDLAGYVRDHVRPGAFPPFFIEERHLSLAGYWTVASLWSASLEQGTLPPPPPPFDERRYLSAVVANGHRDASCIMLGCVALSLRAGDLLVTAPLLKAAIAFDAPASGAVAATRAGIVAQLLQGRLRSEVGVDPKLPAALAPLLDRVDTALLVRELQAQRDCSTAGTGLVEPLLSPPPSNP